VIDKGARGVVLGLLLASACGGAEFVLAASPPEDGGVTAEGGAEGGPSGVEAGDAGRADGGAPTLPEADGDAPDVDAALPACATVPSVLQNCSPAPANVPTSTCMYLCRDGGTDCIIETLTTPPQCNSWCTFTCACLVDAGICGSNTVAICQGDLFTPITLECTHP
jgi:hypothetical protein